jgi:myo-inositol-1(or 4)-monophosphatase
LSQGHLTGLVAYQNELWDLVGGVLIAEEAGATVARDAGGRWVAVAHPDALPSILDALELAPER